MKLLFAYDGSECSEAAIEDLVRAGLPAEGQALVLTVAEVWLPPPGLKANVTGIRLDAETSQIIRNHLIKAEKAVEEARLQAIRAGERLQSILPEWKISGEASYGSPAWEILTRADKFRPDLIVAGSHGRSALGRLLTGSVSQKILTEANCSVRIARNGHGEAEPRPARLVVGFDGSTGADAAVKAVTARSWPSGTVVRMIAAADPLTPSLIGKLVVPIAQIVEEVNETEHRWLEKKAERALRALRRKGLEASFQVFAGHPKQVLVHETKNWGADCVFVGANAFGSRMERFLIGSVSAAVAAHAPCSVEIVRKRRPGKFKS
ncbi:MAG: universal stress protein [Acidobacteria bacterium]|nr:universal stress protein [Acidobacteriota bacterium]